MVRGWLLRNCNIWGQAEEKPAEATQVGQPEQSVENPEGCHLRSQEGRPARLWLASFLVGFHVRLNRPIPAFEDPFF